VYPVKVSDISEEYIASIFRVEEYAKPETIMTQQTSFFLGFFFNPEDEGDVFLRNIDWTTRHYILEDKTLQLSVSYTILLVLRVTA
jgi:hypothetical protein